MEAQVKVARAFVDVQLEGLSTAQLMDRLHDSAVVLSDTIRALNKRGISISLQPAPVESEHLIQLVFTC
jgi:hypothetical protein